MATDLIVCGAGGRMASSIVGLAARDPDFRVVAGIEAPGVAAVGSDAGEVAGVGPIGVRIEDDYGKAVRPDAVTLDFTTPEATLEHMRIAAQRSAPIVVGTTGFDAAQRAELEELAVRTRTILAPNMSIGINVLLMLARAAARALGDDFDPEVLELHHRKKVDAPSGTALALARAVCEALGRDLERDATFGRRGIVGTRPDNEVGVVALRGGDAVGDHTIYFVGMGERLELTHRSQSRECLARGALRAAQWVARQKQPGCYSMADVLGLKE